MRYRQWGIRGLTFLALLIVALIPLLPLILRGEYPLTHEKLRYAALTEYFQTAILNGVWYPRWLPNLAGGYGYPTFVFYQPLFFFLTSFIEVSTGISPAIACLTAIGVASFVGACGVYLLARMRGSRPFSLLAGVLFLVTPYFFVDTYVRGDWSESLAMLLTPWPIYLALQIQARVREGGFVTAQTLGFAVSLAAIIMSHPATATGFCGCLALFVAGVTLDLSTRENRVLYLKMTSIAILLGLVISSPYWETVLRMRRYIPFETLTADYFAPSNHVVFPMQLVSRYWGYGASVVGKNDEMSFQLGSIHLVLALAGLYAGRRDRKIWAAFVCYAILIVLMLPWARHTWDHVPELTIMQFPWRLLSVIGIFQLYVTLGLARAGRPSIYPSLILLLAMLVFQRQNRDQFRLNPDTPAANKWSELGQTMADQFAADAQSTTTYANINEFLPRTAEMPPEHRGTSVVEVTHGTVQPSSDSTDFKLDYQIDTDVPTSVLVRQFYFPGWRVELDNQALSRETLERTLTPQGLMTVAVDSPGRHRLRAWYDGPPFSTVRNVFVVLISVFLTVVLFRFGRPRQSVAG